MQIARSSEEKGENHKVGKFVGITSVWSIYFVPRTLIYYGYLGYPLYPSNIWDDLHLRATIVT